MARRLPVVVSQSSSGTAAGRHLEEALITSLLVESGLDLNIVPHLEDLSHDHTGLLCLEGIQGAMVLISWLSPAEAQLVLSRSGIGSRLGRTRFDGALPPGQTSGSRVLFAIDFNAFESPEPISAEIRRIRDDLATPTVSLLGPALQPLSPPLPVSNAARAPLGIGPKPRTLAESVEETSHRQATEDDDPALQRLVDMLDEMDL